MAKTAGYERAYRNSVKVKVTVKLLCPCGSFMIKRDTVPEGVVWEPYIECGKCEKGQIVTVQIEAVDLPDRREGEECHHVEPPALTPEDIKWRIEHLEQRHWCPQCERKIFSEFYRKWREQKDRADA